MSTTDEVQARGDGSVILPPYTPDHGSGAYRWGRIAVVVLVVVFCIIYGMAVALFTPFLIVGLMVPIPIGLMFVIWALPDTRTAPTHLVAPLLFALMLFLIMWPNYIAIALPGLPWITMERLDGIPLALTVLICASTSREFRTVSARALKAAPLVSGLFIGFLVIQALSIFLSKDPVQSIDRYFVAQLGWTSVFFASVYVFLKPGRVEKMAILLWGMGIAVGLIAVMEWRVQHVLWAGHIPSFLQINDRAVARTLAGANRFGIYRATSTFGTPLGLGEYMALIMPLVLGFTFGAYKTSVRLAAAVSIAFVVFVAVISGSRVGTIGCLAGVSAYAAAWAALKWRGERNSLVGPAISLGFVGGAGLFVLATLFVGRLRGLFWGNGSEKLSDADRNAQWALGIPKVLHHPEGYGIGMGGQALGYRPFGMLTIDNYYLDIMLDYGIIGFILYYGMFAGAIWYCAKGALQKNVKIGDFQFFVPLAVSLVVFILIKSSFSEQNNHPVVFMMLGIVVALVYRSAAEKAQVASQPATVAQTSSRSTPRVRRLV